VGVVGVWEVWDVVGVWSVGVWELTPLTPSLPATPSHSRTPCTSFTLRQGRRNALEESPSVFSPSSSSARNAEVGGHPFDRE